MFLFAERIQYLLCAGADAVRAKDLQAKMLVNLSMATDRYKLLGIFLYHSGNSFRIIIILIKMKMARVRIYIWSL